MWACEVALGRRSQIATDGRVAFPTTTSTLGLALVKKIHLVTALETHETIYLLHWIRFAFFFINVGQLHMTCNASAIDVKFSVFIMSM